MPDTWAERFNANHAPAGSATGGQFAAGSGSGKAAAPTPTNQHPVGQGEKGKRVSDLQARLNALGTKPPLVLDGIFGPKTRAAVKAFQVAHGLKADGLVGPKTTAALRIGRHPAHHHAAHHHHHHHPGSKTPAKAAAPAKAAPAKTAAPPVKAAPAKTAPPVKPVHRASDLKYGHGSALWEYWTKGGGFAKWSGAVHKWTTLHDLLLKAGVPAASADGLATNIIQAVMPGYMKQAAEARGKGGASRMGQTEDTDSGKGMPRAELFRTYGLEDAHIVRTAEGDSTGRVVEAYCAVFDDPVEIKDFQGHYIEDIDRAAFNKRIADVQRSRAGFGLVKCMYNHGLTIHGTPAERFSMPCAVTEHISAEGRGVLTRARYLDTALGNEVLELWRSGAITAQSFTGAIVRSSPELRRGEQYRPRGGELPRVRRLEMGLREFGGTPFPAYSGAELVGVRMSPLGTWQAADEEYDDEALLPDGEAAAGEPLTRADGDGEEHSARYHQHALYRLNSAEARERAGLVW